MAPLGQPRELTKIPTEWQVIPVLLSVTNMSAQRVTGTAVACVTMTTFVGGCAYYSQARGEALRVLAPVAVLPGSSEALLLVPAAGARGACPVASKAASQCGRRCVL